MHLYLIKSIFIHSILYIFESITILSQFMEIFNNHFNNKPDKSESIKVSIPLKFLKILNIRNKTITFVIFFSFILIFDVFYLLYDIIKWNSKIIGLIFINFYELFYFRLLFTFYISMICSLKDYYFFISLLIAFNHLSITINNFRYFHLYDYVPSFISLPYDNLSLIIDTCNTFAKILISLSLNGNGKISKYFYFLSFISYIATSLYLILIMIKKSYFLMNNIILSKIRLSMFFGITINLSFMLFYKSNKILSINFLYVIFYVFIASLIGTIIYDPFDLIIIRKNNNDSNAIYYLFAYYSDLQNRIKFQQALNFHRKQCNICDMCIKLQGNKSITEEENDREHNNDFFNKIYSGHNRYLNLLKFIMENYIEQKFKYISCSPHIFMNILHLYYINYMNDKNLQLNLEILYIILNEENKIQIDEQRILIKQLVLMNDFIFISRKILSQLKKIINKSFSDSPIQFENIIQLSISLKEISSNHFTNFLFNKKNINNGNNSFYLLSICSIFFEELFNEHISNNQIKIRDHFSQYEETINYLYHNNNNITLLLDVINFDLKVIRIGKDLIDYINCSFFVLFPKNLEQIQRKYLKDLLLSLIKVKKKTFEPSENNNFPEIKLIIISKSNYIIYYRLLKLKINFLYKEEMSHQIVLNGEYIIDNNIIISNKSKTNKKENLIGFGDERYHYPSKVKTNFVSLKVFLSENNLDEKHLQLLFSINQERDQYNIYYYNSYKTRKSSIENYKHLKGSLTHQSLIEKYKRDEMSFASIDSPLSINSNVGNYSKKRKFDSNHESLSIGIFRIFQIIEILLLFIIIMMLIIGFIHQEKLQKQFESHYTKMTDFRLFYRKLYHTIASFLVLMCIAETPEKTTCINYMEEYSNRYYNNYPNHFINFTHLLQEENYLLANTIGDTLQTFQSSLNFINDKVINQILEEKFTFIQIVPNLKIKTINIIKNQISLNEGFELIVNCFIIMKNYENDYMVKPFYIINYKTNVFQNFNYDAELSTSHIQIYQILLNFYSYEKYLKKIRYRLDDYYNDILKNCKLISLIYQLNIFIIKLILILFLYLYIVNFNSVVLMILNSIKVKLKNNDETFNFKEMFEKKINNLEKLIQIYTENPVTILLKLEGIYHKYKRNIKEQYRKKNNEKEEEEYSKLIKQERKKYFFSIKTLKKSKYDNKYILFIIFLILLSIISFLIQNYYLLKTFDNAITVINLLKISASTEASGYKTIIYYQFLLYLNQTEEEISKIIGYESIDADIQDKYIEIFKTEQNQKKVSNILVFLSEVVSLNCDDFYNLANDDRLNKINIKFPEIKLYDNLSFYCKTTYAMEKHKSEIIFQNQFALMIDGIKSIGNKDYKSIIKYLEKDYLYKCCLFNFFIYRPLRSIVNFKVIKIGTQNIIKKFYKLLYFNLIIDGTTEIIIVLIIISIFIIEVENNYQNIVKLKKIFRLCK